jgi:hypothetical protein
MAMSLTPLTIGFIGSAALDFAGRGQKLPDVRIIQAGESHAPE